MTNLARLFHLLLISQGFTRLLSIGVNYLRRFMWWYPTHQGHIAWRPNFASHFLLKGFIK